MSVLIRAFRPGDEPALRALFRASVRGLARASYTPEQLDAWAPMAYDPVPWNALMQANQPFVAEVETDAGTGMAGYTDLQATGYIDHFFVAPAHAGQGVARALMAHIHAQAALRGIHRLWADVSLTAEPFFAKSGFSVEMRQQVERRGVVLANARMAKMLQGAGAVGQ
ncbi:GNAT family N-acetyltransferase [Acidovorax sp. Root217]|uniref:GNAT family N-acetyltransferase n=1 Tax=Acidovorax sp. Root217 TaxID=1736492 RepID=UPI00070F0B9D|nr:GNAT family N-acetyltransferase [Acidovorax sp. Root217]KRC27270.1 acetyltransferase [Acidovorax sp. Root217]